MKKSKAEKARAKAAEKCPHDYIFMETWQDAEKKYWSFHCRYCLDIVIRSEPLEFLKQDTQ